MVLDLVSYVRGAPNMQDEFAKGYNLVSGIKKDQMQQQAIMQKMAQQQEKQLALQDFINTPNKTAEDYLKISVLAPEVSEPLKQYHESLNEDQKQAKQSTALNLFAALESGNINIAKNILEENIEGAKNSGDQNDYQMFQNLFQSLESNPEVAKKTVGLYLSHALGGDKMGEVLGQLGKERRAQEMQPFEIKAQLQKNTKLMKEMGYKDAQIAKVRAETRRLNRTPEEEAYAAGLKAQAQAPYKSKGLNITTPDGTVISQGGPTGINPELTRTVVTETQKDIAGFEKSISDLDSIVKSYKPEFNTYQYQAENSLNKFFDKFGAPLDKGKIGEYKKYQNNVKQFFNQYRKEITGAAAAKEELKDLEQSLFSVNNSPSEFEAGLKQVQDTVKRHLRIKRKLLREGVSGKSLMKKFNEYVRSGLDDDPRQRALDLKRKGILDPKRVRAVLSNEGYI